MTVPPVAFLLALLSTNVGASPTSSSLAKIEATGKAIYEQDRAAWLATDRLLESSDGAPDDLRGWVVLPSDEGWQVFFVEHKGDIDCSALSVLVKADGADPLRRSEACEPLTTDQRARFLARQRAGSALRRMCSESYNTVVLPHEGAEAAWTVYLLAATQEAGKVVVGGHVRVLVKDGSFEVMDYQQLSKACLTLDEPAPDTGNPRAFLMVTHSLDDHPIETHVFLSLLHKLNIYVITESALWSVDTGKIRLVMDGDEFKEYSRKAKRLAEKENSKKKN